MLAAAYLLVPRCMPLVKYVLVLRRMALKRGLLQRMLVEWLCLLLAKLTPQVSRLKKAHADMRALPSQRGKKGGGVESRKFETTEFGCAERRASRLVAKT